MTIHRLILLLTLAVGLIPIFSYSKNSSNKYFYARLDSNYIKLTKKPYTSLTLKEQQHFKATLIQMLKKDSVLQEMTLLRKQNLVAYFTRIKSPRDTARKAPKDFVSKVEYYKTKGVADPKKYVENLEKIKKALLYSAMKYPELYKLPSEVRRDVQEQGGLNFQPKLNE